MMEQEGFYVGMEDSGNVRRQILGDLKSILSILKRYEKFREKRAEKHRLAMEYKNIVDELGMHIDELKKILPGMEISALPKAEETIKSKKKVESQPAPIRVVKLKHEMQDTELERIEKDLADVEAKLKGL